MNNDTLVSLVELVSQALCSVQPYTVEQVKSELLALNSEQRKMLINPNNELMQGDILGKIKYPIVDESGQVQCVESDVIVLSNTCDCQRDEDILLAPIVVLDSYTTAREMNLTYELMSVDEAPL